MFNAYLRRRIVACLPKGRVAQGIVTLVTGTAVAQIIMICAMPMVTRLYTPAQFGVISLFLSFFGFWASTLSLRYEYALLIACNDEESHVICRLAMIAVFVMSLFSIPILGTLQSARILGFDLLPIWAPYVAALILLGYGLFMVYRSWALRAGLVGRITQATVARSAANAGCRLLLGFIGGGIPALFAAECAGAWGAMLGLARRVDAFFAPSRPVRISPRDLWSIARRYAKFPTLETPSSWVDQLAALLPIPMVAALYGAPAAGWFGLARTMVSLPNSQIGNAVADVFQMELAKTVLNNDFVQARTLFYKLLRKLTLIGLLPLFLTVALAPWAVPWIFGQGWDNTGLVAAIIAPWLYSALIGGPLSRALSVLQAQEYKLVYDVSALFLLTVAFLLAKIQHYSFIETVAAISVAGVLGYVIYVVLLIVVVEMRLQDSKKERP